MKRVLLAAVLTVSVASCGAPVVKYTPNAQALVEQMYKASTDFVRDIPLTAASRVAIINLEGRMTEAASPSVPVYDMLAVALAKRKIPVVERDSEALYASVLESWSSRLPFRVTSPCGQLCSAKPATATAAAPVVKPAPAAKAGSGATIIVQGCSSSCGEDVKPGECKSCKEPTVGTPAKDLIAIVQELSRLRAKSEEEAAKAAAPPPPAAATPGASLGDVNNIATESRNYRDLFSKIILPNWFAADGSKITTDQASATHLLAYRVLTYGTAVFKTINEASIRREVRIDLILRLIRVDDGVVEWSDRVFHTYDEQLPAELESALDESPYTFSPSQYVPDAP